MHLVLSKNAFLVKWGLPILMVVVMATLLVVVGASGGSGSDEVSLGTQEFTDFNPANENVIVGPAEAGESAAVPLVLYTIEIADQTGAISVGGGGLATITLTNNIAEPMANGVGMTRYGDIGGNIVVTADLYAPKMWTNLKTALATPLAALSSYTSFGASTVATALMSGQSGTQALLTLQSAMSVLPGGSTLFGMLSSGTAQSIEAAKLAAAVDAADEGMIEYSTAYTNVSLMSVPVECHPGKTVVVQVPMASTMPPGSVVMLKAVLVYAGSSPLL